ncbi:MAG: helix-turn-helix domain-containing protein, partial [Methyloceanibacter sp.]
MGYRRRRRIYFTEKQKTEIWDRWQRGESMSSIGRRFDRNSSSIYPLLARTGGIRPAVRRRSHLALTLAEREEISRGLRAELSLRVIARQLRRAPSTISREVNRNGGRAFYRAVPSDQAAWDRALRPKPCKLACRLRLCRRVSVKLERKWSPQQIAGWLKRA